ncbi:phage tail tape measure protein [Acidocella sp.]|uniref:phage tail tape measure protein n=1 Tax=Acidocella sp. TaxID=50710 RepID=UPI00262B1E4D|nr:phage tail tape measure protein [Acidocella sp.]
MGDHNLTVKITADVSSLQAKSALAQSELKDLNAQVKRLAAQFREAGDDMKASLAPQLDAAAREAANTRAEIAALNAEMREQSKKPASMFGALTEKIEGTTAKVEGLTERFQVFQNAASAVSEFVMAGLAVEQVGEAFKSVAEMGEQLEQLSERTGMSTEALSGLRMVAIRSGADFGQVGDSMQHLAESMQKAVTTPSGTASEAFRALGISVTDAEGHLRPMRDVLDEVAQKLDGYADGTAKAALAGDIFGQRMGSEMVPVLHELVDAGGLDGATEKTRELGMAISETSARTDAEFLGAMRDSGAALDGLKNQFVQPLLPILTELAADFSEGSSQSTGLKIAVASLDVAFEGVIGTGEAVAAAVTAIVEVAFDAGEAVAGLAEAVVALDRVLDGDFAAAAQAGENSLADLKAAFEDTKNAIGTEWKAEFKIFSGHMGESDTGDGGGDAGNGGGDNGGKGKPQAPTIPPPTSSGDWLKSQNDALTAQTQKIELAATDWKTADNQKLQNDVAFWKAVTAQANLSADQRKAAQAKLTDAMVALHLHQLETQSSSSKSALSAYNTGMNQQVQIAQDAAAAKKQIVQANYQAQVDQWNTEVAQGKMTKAQEVQNEITAQQQMYAADYAEAKAEADLAGLSVVAKAKAFNQIEVMQAQHNALMAQLNTELVQAQVELNKQLEDANKKAAEASRQAWLNAFAPITTAFDASINGVLQGTETLKQAELKAAQSITLAFIDSEAKRLQAALVSNAQRLAQHLATEWGMTAATSAGETARVSVQTAGAEASKGVSLTTALAQMNKYAAQAAGGAYAAVAGIPFVGPVLAPAAAATAYAGVMAFEVLSAEGGMVIGAGENPLTQLHEKEMVLPAHIAQPLLAMTSAGDVFNNSSGGEVHNYHINQTLNAPGGSAGDFSDQVWRALEVGVRDGRHTSGRYPGVTRMMRRGG